MKKTLALCLCAFMLVLGAFAATVALAGAFRDDFMESYRAHNFMKLEYLVKNNRSVIPGEVRALTGEAMAEGKSFEERMDILDIASAMASMYAHWHGDPGPLKAVEALQKEELGKESERLAEIEKWKGYEKYPGNILMRTKEAEYSKEGLSQVVFPHWSHRLYYDCKACHNSIFKMRRGEAEITRAAMAEGRFCMVCHDGKTAFAAKDNCNRCHLVGTEHEEGVLDSKKADLGAIKKTAARTGSTFEPEKLEGSTLPHDKFGFIDWVELRKTGAYRPVSTLDRETDEGKRENSILFETKIAGINGVPFSHSLHSQQINCSSCHPEPLKDELGANKITMREMAEGTQCGFCHGKASFKLADCNRCHSRPAEEPKDGLLTRP
ncbi:MAG TPA: c(7)-type cytochrome triheme domain-containing protein [Thermodesulfobacteriota bacterium]|nr:c(7)-type cytochrome triheme domain-containing protein [Thermodesulfobacteriota bacterium]